MSNSKALKDIITAARPLIEQWLATGEQIAALREAATAQELDWGPIKALLKAQIQDEADDGNRVEKLLAKADKSMAYADMLGWSSEKNNFSSPVSRSEVKATATRMRMEDQAALSQAMADAGLISQEAAAETVQIAQAINDKWGDKQPVAADAGDVPEFLRRAK